MLDRVGSIERRLAAMERAVMVAMEEVDETRAALNDRLLRLERNHSSAPTLSSSPAHRRQEPPETPAHAKATVGPEHLEEVARVAAEAVASSRAQKERLRLHDVRHSALEREVSAMRIRLDASNSPAAPSAHGAEEAPRALLEALQQRVERMEQQLGQQSRLEGVEDRVHSLVESKFRQLLREQEACASTDPSASGRGVSSLAAQSPSTVSGALDVRSLRNDITVLRQDLVRCVVEVEQLMDQQQRHGTSVHSCLATVQRHQLQLDGMAEAQRAAQTAQTAHLDAQHTAAVRRHDRQLASSLEELTARLTAEVQRVVSEHVSEQRRESQCRQDAFAQSLAAAQSASAQCESAVRRLEREWSAEMRREMTRQLREHLDAHRALLEAAQADWQREAMAAVESRPLDAPLLMQRQVEAEVARAWRGGAAHSALQSVRQEVQRLQQAGQSAGRELHEVREALAAVVAVPSASLASLDARVAAIRAELSGLYQHMPLNAEVPTPCVASDAGGSLALAQHVLARQQRLLQEDLLELKSRLRRCEARCGVEGSYKEETGRTVTPLFRGDNATRHTPVRRDGNRSAEMGGAKGVNGRKATETMAPIGAGVRDGRPFRSPSTAELNRSSFLRRPVREEDQTTQTTYDPLSGVFD